MHIPHIRGASPHRRQALDTTEQFPEQDLVGIAGQGHARGAAQRLNDQPHLVGIGALGHAIRAAGQVLQLLDDRDNACRRARLALLALHMVCEPAKDEAARGSGSRRAHAPSPLPPLNPKQVERATRPSAAAGGVTVV